MQPQESISKLKSRIAVLVHYIGVKVDEQDWYAVSDAANDIRELTAKIEVYDSLLKGQ